MTNGNKVCSHSYHDRVYAKHTCPVNTNVCGPRDYNFEQPLPAEEEEDKHEGEEEPE